MRTDSESNAAYTSADAVADLWSKSTDWRGFEIAGSTHLRAAGTDTILFLPRLAFPYHASSKSNDEKQNRIIRSSTRGNDVTSLKETERNEVK